MTQGDQSTIGAGLGMILPSGNIVAEGQIRAMLSAQIRLHTTRLKLVDSAPESLSAMRAAIPEAADLLADVRAKVIGFNCTAASVWSPDLDPQIVADIERSGAAKAYTTAQALVAGLRALSARRIILVTPYVDAVVDREAAFFAHHGFEVLSAHGTGIDSNWDMAQRSPESWQAAVRARADQCADAYVLSCTAIRSLSAIAPLERDLGRPVLTSNQAFAWMGWEHLGRPETLQCGGMLGAVSLAEPVH